MFVLNWNEFFNRIGECVKKVKNCCLRFKIDDKIMFNFVKCIFFKVFRYLNMEFNVNNILDCGIIFFLICFNCMLMLVVLRILMEREINVVIVVFLRKINV